MPHPDYRWSSAGLTPRITRTSVGVYTVRLPGMPLGGAAHVTPYGPDARRCDISSIRRTDLPQWIGVRCWDRFGDPVDTRFTLTYAR